MEVCSSCCTCLKKFHVPIKYKVETVHMCNLWAWALALKEKFSTWHNPLIAVMKFVLACLDARQDNAS